VPNSIRPIIVTPDIDRLRTFYTSLLGAEEIFRYPEEGPVFYSGLRLGDSELGLSSDSGVPTGPPGRVLLSIDVPRVDDALPKVGSLGGHVQASANDMPWGQRVAHIADPDGNVVNLTETL
jgi:catechol 2,3-dioxygenase-like lactoylglutathione lyase family enzyme